MIIFVSHYFNFIPYIYIYKFPIYNYLFLSMPQLNYALKNKNNAQWTPEETERLIKIINECTFEKSGIFEISFKDIWLKLKFDTNRDRKSVQNKCKKLVQQQNVSNYRKVKLVISRHWEEDEECILKDILIEMGAMGKKTSEIYWNDVYSQFKEKRGRNDRDIKALQERYRNYIDPKVYLPNKRKKYNFTKDQITSIIMYKINNEATSWKEMADKLNESIDLKNKLNGNTLHLPHCTPNQVRNKYNTITKPSKERFDILARLASEEMEEMGETNKMNVKFVISEQDILINNANRYA
ncbi:hypothetical protein Glove_261g16 [Diversispora epigaea]|uniref:Myb-like domain-containing protein n=1 Tax=Diversispora epigaea TaxID=1348612 RepID=A0A397I7U6_9GLOM|nr:hypothetical protein Glove_261g16 [Diversispora epigaea]